MDFTEIVRIGITNLARHPLRSLLTVLGIIFGVAAVVSMLAIAEGARYQTLQQIKVLGLENIRVTSRKPTLEGKGKQASASRYEILKYGVKMDEYAHLCQTLDHLKTSVPLRDIRQKPNWRDKSGKMSQVWGTTCAFPDVTNFSVEKGRFIAQYDEELLNRVAVIGSSARRELFAYRNPIGESIEVGAKWYEIVGVMEPRNIEKGGSISVRDYNYDIYIPLKTALVDFGTTYFGSEAGSRELIDVELDEIYFRMESSDFVTYGAATIGNYLNRNHRDQDYAMLVPIELLAQSEKTSRTFDIIMVSIASISLLVGGIGIMNIMLATVTERTREIGTRRAVGAQKVDILLQFLFETVILAFTGGMIGVFLGVGGAWIIVEYSEWKVIVTWQSIVLSFGISGLVGIIFGTYPALKAANLSPIEALRYE